MLPARHSSQPGPDRVRPHRAAPRPGVRLAVALVVLGGVAAACSAAGAGNARLQATCRQVGAVLSDGPDPGADPVGYAEAQVRPLDAVHSPDATVARAITRLDTAFRSEVATGGSPGAARAVAAAERQMDIACPGVAP